MILKTRVIGSWFCLFSLLFFLSLSASGVAQKLGHGLRPPVLTEPLSAIATPVLGTVQLLVCTLEEEFMVEQSLPPLPIPGGNGRAMHRPQPTQATSAKSKQVSGAGSLPPQGLVLRRGTDTGSSCQLSRVPGSVTHLAISLPGPAPCSSGYRSSQQPRRLAAAAR